MTFSDSLALIGLIVAVGFGIYGIYDARDQRKKKDAALRIIRGVAHEARGLAIGIKPALATEDEERAVNDLIERLDCAIARDASAST